MLNTKAFIWIATKVVKYKGDCVDYWMEALECFTYGIHGTRFRNKGKLTA